LAGTGGELLVRGLEAAGVEVVFGLPGVHNLAAWKALRESSIRLVTVRHEQAAVYAADGYARATGRTGVALTTTGPGAANTLGATGEAWASGSPVLVIATDIPTSLRRPDTYRGVLHETIDQAAMFAPVVKSRMKAPRAEDLGTLAQILVRRAVAAPSRPVYLEIPTDLLSAAVDGAGPGEAVADGEPIPAPDDEAIDAAAKLIEGAERPLIWVGGGALRSGAAGAVSGLATRLGAPVITTYMARGLLGSDHPCAVGLPPHVPQVGALWDEADAVVAIGSDLDGMMTQNWRMPKPPALVAINIDAADATKNYEADVIVVGDAGAATSALTARFPPREGVLDAVAAQLTELRAEVRTDVARMWPAELKFLDVFERSVPADAVVVCDMCIAGYWLGAFHPVSGPRKLLYPLGWGTLGCAFPQAMGAALAGAGPTVSVSGDGGFLYAVGELAAVAQENIPLTAVIVDDGGYGMLRFDQRRAGDEPFGVDLDPPDFVALAQAFGITAERVDGLGEDFGAALSRHMADEHPSVLVASAALEPPPTTSPRWYRPID
jgi:thiamine pyrophosphate-dependent acetolactate synthase large subunit-like protein